MASVNDIHNLGDQFQYQLDKLEEADIAVVEIISSNYLQLLRS
jgi:hypothetical protein